MSVDERGNAELAKVLWEDSVFELDRQDAVIALEARDLGPSDPNFIDNFVVPYWNALRRPELPVRPEDTRELSEKR